MSERMITAVLNSRAIQLTNKSSKLTVWPSVTSQQLQFSLTKVRRATTEPTRAWPPSSPLLSLHFSESSNLCSETFLRCLFTAYFYLCGLFCRCISGAQWICASPPWALWSALICVPTPWIADQWWAACSPAATLSTQHRLASWSQLLHRPQQPSSPLNKL